MELLYSIVKKMDVVNVTDGKHLGKICDMLFDFTENRIRGFYVTGSKGFHFTKQDLFVPLSAVVRVGEDVILTSLHECLPHKSKNNSPQPGCPPHCSDGGAQPHQRRSFDEYE